MGWGGPSIAMASLGVKKSCEHLTTVICPHGHAGDRLWVRETWQYAGGNTGIWYAATDLKADDGNSPVSHWKASIHMPRKSSRITLEITGVRVERLNEISEDDAKAEGAPWAAMWAPQEGSHKAGFAQLWESINGAGSWEANPWVWVVDFKRLEDCAA